MNRPRRYTLVWVAGLSWAMTVAARGAQQEARQTVREGNRLFAQQKYPDAYKKYHQAAADLTDTPEIVFNQAATYYKRGDYDKAIELYEQARATKSAELDRKITYNLGNCHHQQAIKIQRDLPKAIQRLGQAARYYRDCLQVDPTFEDARYNLQLAKLLLKHLLDEKKTKEEEKKKGQKKQDRQQNQAKQKKKGGEKKEEKKPKPSAQSQPKQPKEPQQDKSSKQKRPSAADRKKLRKEEAERLLRHAMQDARRRRHKRAPQRRAAPTPGRGEFKDW